LKSNSSISQIAKFLNYKFKQVTTFKNIIKWQI
jgi:hypothetical protein